MEKLKTFIETCIKSKVYKYRGKVYIITEDETIKVLKIIEGMIKDGRKTRK